MSRFGPRLERLVVCGLLVLCALCCLGIAQSTIELELANHKRKSQLLMLDGLALAVNRLQEGPVVELDGLYARRLSVVASRFGATLAFEGGGSSRQKEVPR
ncbi:hypothetical protein LBMAG49_08090 [Planctomycetota bacterium]|nr:hypothetical protein LBMAG49_08090 [Planctomycetota bacterium]